MKESSRLSTGRRADEGGRAVGAAEEEADPARAGAAADPSLGGRGDDDTLSWVGCFYQLPF